MRTFAEKSIEIKKNGSNILVTQTTCQKSKNFCRIYLNSTQQVTAVSDSMDSRFFQGVKGILCDETRRATYWVIASAR